MVISIYATAPSVAAKFIDDGYTKYTNKEKKRKTKHRTAQYIGDLHIILEFNLIRVLIIRAPFIYKIRRPPPLKSGGRQEKF